MIQIYRKEISTSELDRPFLGPANVTFGYQAQRQAFSIWYESTATFDREYIIAGTGHPFLAGKLRASVVMPDGFHVFHLIELPK